jgi:membrane dipeptidase
MKRRIRGLPDLDRICGLISSAMIPHAPKPAVPTLTRRDVLRHVGGLGVLTLTGGTGTLLGACTTAQSGAQVLAADPEIAALVDSAIGIDMHSHAAGANGRPHPAYDLAERIRVGRMTAVCLCHPGDAPVIKREPDNRIRTVRQPNPGELWGFTQRRLRWFDDLVTAQGLRRALRRGDLEAAHRDKTPAIVQTIEGCQFLEGKLERMGEVYRRGVRHLQLVHFFRSDMGDNQTEPADQGGLTPFGRDAIAECNRLGIVIDVAHATREFVAAAVQASKTPLILSHTAVAKGQPAEFSRRISPEHARLVAGAGGVVGVWGSPLTFRSLRDYVDAVAAAVDVAGVEHVGFGTDNSGFGATPVVWDDYRDFPLIVRLMRKRGFSPDDIRKIAGGNYLRVFNLSVKAA